MSRRETVTGKALWFIENHLTGDLSLEKVAEHCGVGRYHATRAFGVTTGLPIMRYVRWRRLTAAARRLADGAPDILEVAISSGYGSHEAFTRAFREEFGVTPELVRERGTVDGLRLLAPLEMAAEEWEEIVSPRISEGAETWVVGLGSSESALIPGLWERFGPHIGLIPGQVGRVAYGVCHAEGYLAGVAVSDAARVGGNWASMRLAAAQYAVFRHEGHVSTIRRTWFSIWNTWLAASGLAPTGDPEFERYGESFDPRAGTGGMTIWVPVTRI